MVGTAGFNWPPRGCDHLTPSVQTRSTDPHKLQATAGVPTLPFRGGLQPHRFCTVGNHPPPTNIRPVWIEKIRWPHPNMRLRCCIGVDPHGIGPHCQGQDAQHRNPSRQSLRKRARRVCLARFSLDSALRRPLPGRRTPWLHLRRHVRSRRVSSRYHVGWHANEPRRIESE